MRPVELYRTETKRYWLKMSFDDGGKGTAVVILKNPSRATGDVSDKTVFNVASYIYRNRLTNPLLKDVGAVIILNLIPAYETYSHKLKERGEELIDMENLKFIKKFAAKANVLIAAWGDAPKGLEKEYNEIRDKALAALTSSGRQVYFVHKLSIKGNPKHGQIWGYKDKLLKFNQEEG